MKKTVAIIIFIGALITMAESTPTNNLVHGEEAHHNPALQVEYIENDPTGWAIANLGMGIGGLIGSIGLVLFAQGTPSISDNKNIRMASKVAATTAVLGALIHAYLKYKSVALPAEGI